MPLLWWYWALFPTRKEDGAVRYSLASSVVVKNEWKYHVCFSTICLRSVYRDMKHN